jgi:tetratricopeptide (TPR) repeat protein
VDVVSLPHVTLVSLQNALREAANADQPRPFHVVHFIGHGRYDPASGRSVLLFEDEQGQVDEVDAERLVTVLRPYDIRLVFLNACQSVQSSALAAARGFAPSLMRIGVPAIIGMQVTVLDRVASRFSRDFYAALADNQPVDASLRDARQLHTGTRRRGADLAIPVCYLRSPSGQIMELRPPERIPLTRETWRPWLQHHATPRRLVAGLIALIGLAASLLGIVPFVLGLFADPPVMTGDYNIAVAQFGELDARGQAGESADARALAESLYRTLSTELSSFPRSGEGFDIEIRSPSDTGEIRGETPADRARAAAQLALQIKADLVVYGNLVPGQGSTTLRPEFYLSEKKLQNAEELVGQYRLGSDLTSLGDIATNLVARRELRERLLSRTRAMSRFVIGLGYYALRQFEQALGYFEDAAADEGWADEDGKEVLYLFLGNAAGNLRDLAAAKAHYDRALELNGEYARAQLGQAEVLFQRSHGSCESDDIDVRNPAVSVDPAGLNRAEETFRRVLSAADQPVLSDIKTKVAFGLGRVYLCLSQSLVADRWADAEREFLAVVADFQRGNERVRDMAAEAHANLAIVYLPAQGEPGAEAKYRRAAKEYAKAIQVARIDERRAVFADGLAFVCDRLRQAGGTDPSCSAAMTSA